MNNDSEVKLPKDELEPKDEFTVEDIEKNFGGTSVQASGDASDDVKVRKSTRQTDQQTMASDNAS